MQVFQPVELALLVLFFGALISGKQDIAGQ